MFDDTGPVTFQSKEELLAEAGKVSQDLVARLMRELVTLTPEEILKVVNNMKRELNEPSFLETSMTKKQI